MTESRSLRSFEFGQGPPLVILPSHMLTASYYFPLARALAKSFRVIVLQLPGSGFGLPAGPARTLDELTQIVIEFLKHQALERALIFGHSQSGALAMSVALHSPRRVKGLILADIMGVRAQSWWSLLMGRLKDLFAEFGFTMLALPTVLYNFLNHTQNFWFQTKFSLHDTVHSVMPISEVETLIAWGGNDHTSPLSQAHELRQEMGYASLCIAEYGSHHWVLMEAERFAEAVVAWALPQQRKSHLSLVSIEP